MTDPAGLAWRRSSHCLYNGNCAEVAVTSTRDEIQALRAEIQALRAWQAAHICPAAPACTCTYGSSATSIGWCPLHMQGRQYHTTWSTWSTGVAGAAGGNSNMYVQPASEATVYPQPTAGGAGVPATTTYFFPTSGGA